MGKFYRLQGDFPVFGLYSQLNMTNENEKVESQIYDPPKKFKKIRENIYDISPFFVNCLNFYR